MSGNLFKRRSHYVFDYKPRYYDEGKEKYKVLENDVDATKNTQIGLTKKNLKSQWNRNKRQVANSKQDKKKSGSRGNEETEKANENMKCKQSEESSICKDCGMSNPPEDLIMIDEIDEEEDVSWIHCVVCWFHLICLGLPTVQNTNTWFCYSCNEKW